MNTAKFSLIFLNYCKNKSYSVMHITMKYTYYIFSAALLFTSRVTMCGIFIVVHGTWGTASTWSVPGGDFFDILEAQARKLGHKAITYTWSGYLDEDHRAAAGKSLAKLIRSYPSKTEFFIIAHSHGANVAILASQELAKIEQNKHRIKIVYALGTPVDHNKYMPNMEIIEYFYNLFSFKDLVQPVLGYFHRTYPPHERIANIRILINDKQPDHTTIHHPALGRWLPNLHEMLTHNECSPAFAFHIPGVIDFYDTIKPRYTLDIDRDTLLEKDRTMQEHILALFRKREFEIMMQQELEGSAAANLP
jgi:hypothetical protein